MQKLCLDKKFFDLIKRLAGTYTKMKMHILKILFLGSSVFAMDFQIKSGQPTYNCFEEEWNEENEDQELRRETPEEKEAFHQLSLQSYCETNDNHQNAFQKIQEIIPEKAQKYQNAIGYFKTSNDDRTQFRLKDLQVLYCYDELMKKIQDNIGRNDALFYLLSNYILKKEDLDLLFQDSIKIINTSQNVALQKHSKHLKNPNLAVHIFEIFKKTLTKEEFELYNNLLMKIVKKAPATQINKPGKQNEKQLLAQYLGAKRISHEVTLWEGFFHLSQLRNSIYYERINSIKECLQALDHPRSMGLFLKRILSLIGDAKSLGWAQKGHVDEVKELLFTMLDQKKELLLRLNKEEIQSLFEVLGGKEDHKFPKVSTHIFQIYSFHRYLFEKDILKKDFLENLLGKNTFLRKKILSVCGPCKLTCSTSTKYQYHFQNTELAKKIIENLDFLTAEEHYRHFTKCAYSSEDKNNITGLSMSDNKSVAHFFLSNAHFSPIFIGQKWLKLIKTIEKNEIELGSILENKKLKESYIIEGWQKSTEIVNDVLRSQVLAEKILRKKNEENQHVISNYVLMDILHSNRAHIALKNIVQKEIERRTGFNQSQQQIEANISLYYQQQRAEFQRLGAMHAHNQEQLKREWTEALYQKFIVENLSFQDQFLPSEQEVQAKFTECAEKILNKLENLNKHVLYQGEDLEFFKKNATLALELLMGRKESEIYKDVHIPVYAATQRERYQKHSYPNTPNILQCFVLLIKIIEKIETDQHKQHIITEWLTRFPAHMEVQWLNFKNNWKCSGVAFGQNMGDTLSLDKEHKLINAVLKMWEQGPKSSFHAQYLKQILNVQKSVTIPESSLYNVLYEYLFMVMRGHNIEAMDPKEENRPRCSAGVLQDLLVCIANIGSENHKTSLLNLPKECG